MSDEKPVREQDKFMLRLPDGMRERISDAAKANRRSMNAEIVAALEEKYPEIEYPELSFLDEIDELTRKLERIREARLQEAAENWSDAFIDEVADKIGPKAKSLKRNKTPSER
ncbi:Arc family DNA-binding protein [Rhizobium sp. NTR19]|uniref:Arc family DNA-binding protein n=1 Tax=Neorhizobium turbinariae TaxID=2937795 RepID=A0ABT0IME7_9HYPH|nr:Arc family DNA-binding protein [Neorhizobium turbinariae]MCK8779060.1 Arc family DNA-binding protein [Neorhizobium turbinariae]